MAKKAPFMSADITKYLHHLDDLDMPQNDKIAFLQALWVYGERALDLICGVDPTQLALGLPAVTNSHLPDDELDSSNNIQTNFNKAVEGCPTRKDVS